MPIFTLRGICTFSMHTSWQEQGFWKISSIDHFGEFLEKFACPDLSFLSKFQHFLAQTFNLQKWQYSLYSAFVPSLRIPRGRSKVSEKFRRSTILVNFWKNLHVRTLVIFRYFNTFFLTLLISKNANIHATGPLYLHCASHMAGTRFRFFFVDRPL